ncbi:LacI family DNA-binding transcriptional regulator [Propionibacterium acidifaciens]|uniref:LacI family DNA-binding transcriptional regulator n=1 Tax=Propionibacterium acidifaciens TaxID=556499 RepID=UPI000427C81D|nr:LacI family DNA-binding transcriptional regulator [Propionibacterium acidifaciens]
MTEQARRRPTLVDLADAAGCSTSLASIVMRGAPGASEATRRRVMAAAERIGYRPDQRARSLRRSTSGLIGVAYHVSEPFHADLVEGLYEVEAPSGDDFDLVLGAVVPGRGVEQTIEPLLRQRCEAIILIGTMLPVARLRRIREETPLVLVARRVRAAGIDVVRTDDHDGQRLAIEHLIGLGHRSIAYVDGGQHPGAATRRRSYRDTMAAHGLGDRVRVVAGGNTEEEGIRATRRLLKGDERPTAIAAFNDRAATGVLTMLIRAGLRVPEDVSVIGFDDARIARTTIVPLTTVRQDTALMARVARERAAGLARQRFVAGEQVLVPELTVRQSTGPVPRS